jgi:hypothetical protein
MEGKSLVAATKPVRRKLLILSHLQAWLAALDDFRNWLIQQAA